MTDLSLFIDKNLNEAELLSFFNAKLGIAFESLEHQRDGAEGLVTCLGYTQGFPLLVSVSWSKTASISKRAAMVAQELADRFQARVLLEADDSISDTTQERWLLAEPGSLAPRPVRTLQHRDGIEPVTDAE